MAMGANDKQVGGSHYRSKIQHWDYVLANEIPYIEAQVIKYLTRWRMKNGHEDLRKAQHYLQKLFESERIPWDSEAAAKGIAGASAPIHVEGCMCEHCKESRAKNSMLTQAGAGIPRYTSDPPGFGPNSSIHQYDSDTSFEHRYDGQRNRD